MGFAINEIKDAQLKQLAEKYDNGDKVVDKNEIEKVVSDELAKTLSSTGRAEMQEMNYELDDSNGFSKWLNNKDKISTDGNDDGHLSFWDGAKSFGKGLVGGIVKGIVNHPILSAAAVGLGVAAMAATGGAAAPILWGLGAVATAYTGGKSIYDYSKAETDGEAKMALEGMGTATQSAILLGATYNSTMAAAKNAGVNTEGNILQTMKSSAEVSAKNIKGNYLTWKTGVVHADSNKPQGAETILKQEMQPQHIKEVQDAAPGFITDPENVPIVQSKAIQYADFVSEMKNATLPSGNKLTNEDICALLLNLEEAQLKNPQSVIDILPEAEAFAPEKMGFAIWKCLYS